MQDRTPSSLALLIQQRDEVNLEILGLKAEYKDKRKGSKYRREYDVIEKRQTAIQKRIDGLGKTFNLVQIQGMIQGGGWSTGANRVVMFYTNISVEDAKTLAIKDAPGMEIMHAGQVATGIVLKSR